MGITEVTGMEALLIALSGILVVFMMLGILSVVITVISRIIPADKLVKASAITAAGAADGSTADSIGAASTPAVPYGGSVKLLNVDEKTAACLMAIVSHETKIPLDQLVFKSIKALNE